MDIRDHLEGDAFPLQRIPDDGGYAAIFRTIGCVGDSLSSGELVSLDKDRNIGYHDLYEYSWGQFIARATGCKAYNFSMGGMTARAYMQGFAEDRGFWDKEKACQAYIIALGVNDIAEALRDNVSLGSLSDISDDRAKNAHSFTGYYAAIVQRLKEISPDAKFFFMTMPKSDVYEGRQLEMEERHAEIMYELAGYFTNSYVIDLRRYGPVYDEYFRDKFYMTGHLTVAGYLYTAKVVMAYIDFIVRHNMSDFRKSGFIGTPYINVDYD